jgi:hypothetical protein
MKGLWTAGDIESEVASSSGSAEKGHLMAIMSLLERNKAGLSNAELDAALNNNSQWVAMWHLRELLAARLIEYRSDLFGEPGKYIITESGLIFLQRSKESKDTRQA